MSSSTSMGLLVLSALTFPKVSSPFRVFSYPCSLSSAFSLSGELLVINEVSGSFETNRKFFPKRLPKNLDVSFQIRHVT